MSAYIVSTYQIDAILSAYGAYLEGKIDREELTRLGNILLQANYDSVNYRYTEIQKAPLYIFRKVKVYSPQQIILSCDNLDYQSCEPENWKQTKAYKIINKIKEEALRYLLYKSKTSNKLKWSLEEPEPKNRKEVVMKST